MKSKHNFLCAVTVVGCTFVIGLAIVMIIRKHCRNKCKCGCRASDGLADDINSNARSKPTCCGNADGQATSLRNENESDTNSLYRYTSEMGGEA